MLEEKERDVQDVHCFLTPVPACGGFFLQKSCFLSSSKITSDQILEKYVENVEMHKTTGEGAEPRPVDVSVHVPRPFVCS